MKLLLIATLALAALPSACAEDRGKLVLEDTFDRNESHDLVIHVVGDTVSVSIDGKPVASLSSEGVANPTKRLIRLSVPHQAWVDDVMVFALTPAVQK